MKLEERHLASGRLAVTTRRVLTFKHYRCPKAWAQWLPLQVCMIRTSQDLREVGRWNEWKDQGLNQFLEEFKVRQAPMAL